MSDIKYLGNGRYEISERELHDLMRESAICAALANAGVEKEWGKYSAAMKDFLEPSGCANADAWADEVLNVHKELAAK